MKTPLLLLGSVRKLILILYKNKVKNVNNSNFKYNKYMG